MPISAPKPTPAPLTESRSRLIELSFVMALGVITRFLAVAMAAKQFRLGWLFNGGTEMGFMATSLLRGEGLGSPFGGHTGSTAMIGPTYPIFVAAIFKIFGAYSGHAAMAVMVVQAAVSLLNLWLIMMLAKQLWPNDSATGHRAALIAGTYWAISLPVFFMPTILWDTTFTACVLTAALLLASTYQQRPTLQRLWVFCAFCGLAYLVNPALLPVAIALVLWASFHGHRLRGINPTLAVATFLVVCSPWPIRNAVTMHAFIPIRECLGIELNMGNHAGSDGHMEESLFPLFNAAELSEYTQVGEVAYVQHKARQAVAYMRANPSVFLDLTFQRFIRFWAGTGNRAGSILFAVDTLPSTLLGLLGLGLLLMRRRALAVPFALVCILFPLPYYITHAEFKYRMTLDPLMLALSAYALLSIAAWLRHHREAHATAKAIPSSTSPATLVARSFAADQSGQAVIVAAASIVVLIACLGLAVDVGHLRYEKKRLQQAADAAALSAGLEFITCGTSYNCTAMQNAAKTAAIENGYTPAALTTNCASSANTGVVMTVNNPVCALGSADPNSIGSRKNSYVEVVLTENVSSYFAQVLGFNSFPIAVRAEAGKPLAPCIYVLDQRPLLSVAPIGAVPLNNGLTVAGLAGVTANCPIVDESSSLLDFNCLVGAGVVATKITVHGPGSLDLLCGVSPTPQYNSPIPTPADPLAYLSKPAIPSTCTGSPTLGLTTLQVLGTQTLQPGRYCGGITIGPLANVTFNPGVYVLSNTSLLGLPLAGGLTISAGAHVTGHGVTFYNVNDAALSLPTGGIVIAGNVAPVGNISLIAPTSGTYTGILFFQDGNDTAAAAIAASSAYNTVLEGAFYFPKAPVTYAVAGNARFNILVAYDINFGVLTGGNTAYENSVFGNDYSQLTGGSPIPATGSVLVQ